MASKKLVKGIIGDEIWNKGIWSTDGGKMYPHWSLEGDSKIFIYGDEFRIIGLSYADYGTWSMSDPKLAEKVRERLTKIINNDWHSWETKGCY